MGWNNSVLGRQYSADPFRDLISPVLVFSFSLFRPAPSFDLQMFIPNPIFSSTLLIPYVLTLPHFLAPHSTASSTVSRYALPSLFPAFWNSQDCFSWPPVSLVGSSSALQLVSYDVDGRMA